MPSQLCEVRMARLMQQACAVSNMWNKVTYGAVTAQLFPHCERCEVDICIRYNHLTTQLGALCQ